MKRKDIKIGIGVRGIMLLLLFALAGGFQLTLGQTYCTPGFTNVAGYGIGMANLTIGNMTNNTGAPNSAVPYNDYTSMRATAIAGATVNVTYTATTPTWGFTLTGTRTVFLQLPSG
jgi:hypothetical protein